MMVYLSHHTQTVNIIILQMCSGSCSQDYVQLFYGTSFDTHEAININSRARDGKICSRRQMDYQPIFVYDTDTITIYYHTDNSNSGTSGKGLRIDFIAQGEFSNTIRPNAQSLQAMGVS